MDMPRSTLVKQSKTKTANTLIGKFRNAVASVKALFSFDSGMALATA